MKVAVVGSRNIKNIDIKQYIPENTTLIISGGAKGVDSLAEEYANKNQIPKLIFLPDYDKYGKKAPLVRNNLIVDNADIIVALWDGFSKGTKYTIDYAKKSGKEIKLHLFM